MLTSLLISALTSFFTLVELNCENLFDCRHDSLKQDYEFTPDGSYHWTPTRYWQHLNRTAQTILACGGEEQAWQLPDLVALCEVENDSVLVDLTRRSLLRSARYEYVMTDSPDARGIDVALLYSPFTFQLLNHHAIRVPVLPGMRPTRDILYVSGRLLSGDTLHVFVTHMPSRSGGEKPTRPFRRYAASRLLQAVDSVRSLSSQAHIVVVGDFNDYANDKNMRLYRRAGLCDISADATGSHGAKATYRYHGRWASLDHIMVSEGLLRMLSCCLVFDAPFLLADDERYGGLQPRRNYLGPRYLNGFSDHLPLVARFGF
ncbi:MAG: endonuclease/exonuclease/phosphatase family protein [Prevotella sp.]|nr:endonuclease/exonuclease/phosphatase family protein [Prevotella sp.]